MFQLRTCKSWKRWLLRLKTCQNLEETKEYCVVPSFGWIMMAPQLAMGLRARFVGSFIHVCSRAVYNWFVSVGLGCSEVYNISLIYCIGFKYICRGGQRIIWMSTECHGSSFVLPTYNMEWLSCRNKVSSPENSDCKEVQIATWPYLSRKNPVSPSLILIEHT